MIEFRPTQAVVRRMPSSFFQALTQHAPRSPIQVPLAMRQHAAYSETLRGLGLRLHELPAEEGHPDCCFIEDTAVIVGRRAAICQLGAQERQGEERVVRELLTSLGLETVDVSGDATVDGGDVLFTGRELIVGLSRRTNEAGARRLAKIFAGLCPVLTVPVEGTLHLKSLLSAWDPGTILIAGDPAGRKIRESLEPRREFQSQIRWVELPDSVAANVLAIGETIVIQAGFPRSEKILSALAAEKGKRLLKLEMSEMIKADGALTCCSLLF